MLGLKDKRSFGRMLLKLSINKYTLGLVYEFSHLRFTVPACCKEEEIILIKLHADFFFFFYFLLLKII